MERIFLGDYSIDRQGKKQEQGSRMAQQMRSHCIYYLFFTLDSIKKHAPSERALKNGFYFGCTEDSHWAEKKAEIPLASMSAAVSADRLRSG